MHGVAKSQTSHVCFPPLLLRHAFEELDRLGILLKSDVSFLDLGGSALSAALTLDLAVGAQGVDGLDLYAENLFHRFLDLGLVGGLVDHERCSWLGLPA